MYIHSVTKVVNILFDMNTMMVKKFQKKKYETSAFDRYIEETKYLFAR